MMDMMMAIWSSLAAVFISFVVIFSMFAASGLLGRRYLT